jgi:formyl-CoA transferase
MNGEGAEAGGQQPSDVDPDRRLSHARWLHEPRRLRHKIWVRLCNAIGAPELATHADYATAALRSQNRDLLHAELEAHLAPSRHRRMGRTAERGRRSSGPIYSIDEAFSDPQVQPPRHRRHARRRRLPRPAGDAQPHAAPRRAPSARAGEHTDAVLREIGFDDAEIERLKSQGIV